LDRDLGRGEVNPSPTIDRATLAAAPPTTIDVITTGASAAASTPITMSDSIDTTASTRHWISPNMSLRACRIRPISASHLDDDPDRDRENAAATDATPPAVAKYVAIDCASLGALISGALDEPT
jgi:hypothetical protein